MRRVVLYPLTCAVALATAVALLGAAAALGDGRGGSSPAGAATEAAVRRFYAAANAAILAGDVAALEAAVAPDFGDHDPPPGVAPGRAGLGRYLAALHATSPETELVVEEVVAAGDRALARVAVRGADPGAFLGLPLADERPRWGRIDAWRVAGGRVIERWGGADRLSLLEPLGRVALDAPLPVRPVVALDRFEIAPGGRLEARLPAETRLVYPEVGALTVEVVPSSPGSALIAAGDGRPTEVEPGGFGTPAAGDLLVLPPRTGHALRNDAAAPGAALVMTMSRAVAAAYTTGRCGALDPEVSPSCSAGAAPAAAVWPLAGGRTTELPEGPLVAAIGRVTLGPGAELASPGTGPVLLAVEAGSLDVEADSGTAWVRGGTGKDREVAAETLGAGDGALLRLGTAATLRNGGEAAAAVLVVTILPTDGAGAAPRRMPAGAGDGSPGGTPQSGGFRPGAGPTP